MKRISSFRPAYLKMIVALPLLFAAVTTVNAQLYRSKTDPAAAPGKTESAQRTIVSDSIIEQRLVDLAVNGPLGDISGHQVAVANYKVKSARKSWFNLLTLSFNVNDQTYAAQPTGGGYTYPKYFFGLVLPIGTIVSKGAEIKAAKEEVKIAEDLRINQQRQIRADILSKYRTFKNQRAHVVLQSQVVDDIHAAYLQAEKKFNDGSITIETYSDASRNYSSEMTKLLNLQLQQDLAQIEIERIIGVPLETVTNH